MNSSVTDNPIMKDNGKETRKSKPFDNEFV